MNAHVAWRACLTASVTDASPALGVGWWRAPTCDERLIVVRREDDGDRLRALDAGADTVWARVGWSMAVVRGGASFGDGYGEEVADDAAGGWRLVSVSTTPVLALASWAVVTLADRRGDRHGNHRDRVRLLAARFAAGEIGEQERRRRLAVLGDDQHRGLGARR
jgi:hypothetical protein